MRNKIVIGILICVISMTMLSARDSAPKSNLNDKQIARALTNILVGLRSQNDGVIECAFVLLAKIKMKYPEKDISETRSVVDSLSIAHSSSMLRYKAHLSSSICNDPIWFVHDSSIVTENHEKFFILAAQRLQQKMFKLSTL